MSKVHFCKYKHEYYSYTVKYMFTTITYKLDKVTTEKPNPPYEQNSTTEYTLLSNK